VLRVKFAEKTRNGEDTCGEKMEPKKGAKDDKTEKRTFHLAEKLGTWSRRKDVREKWSEKHARRISKQQKKKKG